MKQRTAYGPALALALIAATTIAHAQAGSALRLGVMGELDASLHSSQIFVFPGSAECGEFQSGAGRAFRFGGSASMPTFFSNLLGITARVGWEKATGTLTTPSVQRQLANDPETGELVELDREYRLRASSSLLRLDLLAIWRAAERLSVGVGPTIGYRLTNDITQTDVITNSRGLRFPGGQGEQVMPVAGDASNPLALGLIATIAYELPVGARAVLAPGLTMRADLTGPIRDARWSSFGIGAGASLLFDITSAADEPAPPQAQVTPVQEPEPRKPRLTATIDLYSVDAEGNRLSTPTVHVQEVLHRRHAPLLPIVFFDRDSSSIARRYRERAPRDIDSFSIDGLAGESVLGIQHHAMDVIGARLRRNRSATVTLTGMTSGDEPPALARARAESVRTYLTTIWGIQSSRLKIIEAVGTMPRSSEATEDGRADNRRVEIGSSMAAVLAPIVTVQVERDFDPPIVHVDPSFEAEAGVRAWSLGVFQGPTTLARYSSTDSVDEASGLAWNIVFDRLDTALAPLVAELTLADSAGSVVTARTQVPLLLERNVNMVDGRIQLHGDRERITHTLVGFDYNAAEPGTRNDLVLRSIARMVRSGARVTVTGYTDRIGDERYNAGLSAQRAGHVASTLRSMLAERGVGDVVIETGGGGVETTRFENSLPEGRVLSRGVAVVIEQIIAADSTEDP